MKRIFILLLAIAASLQAQTPKKATPPAPPAVPKVEIEKYTLPNGMDVILHVDRKLPIVHVNQWYHVGSKNERPGRTGFAHLFEHMMFQGSKNAPGEYFEYAEKAGANIREGGVNGTTNTDRTNYFVTAPAGKLEYLLWFESDRLATLTDVLTKEKLDNQRDVVKNERRQGLENTPYGRWFKLITENIHPADHPYHWTTIGSPEDLTAASVEDVTEFFKTFYTPNNLSLVIAGDFDPAEAKRLVEKYFGSIPAGPPLDRPNRYIPKLDGEKIVDAMDRVPQERVYMAWPTPQYFAPGDAEIDLIGLILTDGLASRLQKILVYDKQLASDVTSFNWTKEIDSTFVVIATARPGSSLPQIEKIITQEISRLAKEGPTAEELARAKTKQQYTFVTGLERIGGFGGKADLLNTYNTFLGDPNKFEEDVARYQRVTASDIKETAARWLDTRDRLIVRFHPETSGRSEVTVDRSKVPDVGTDRAFQAPEVKMAKLDNGLTVAVVERHDLPKVNVTVQTKAGSVADPPGKEGVAQLTMQTIDRGTAKWSALEIENALGDLGTALANNAGRESSSLQMDLLKSSLAPAMNVLADVVLNPTFPKSEFDREQKLLSDRLAQQSKDAGAIAARVRPMLAFGPDHPYGRPVQGLPSTVQRITRDDLVRYHKEWFKPGSTAIVFVGDVTMDEAMDLARKQFGSWTGGAAPSVMIPDPKPAPSGKIYVVDRQDAAQTVVVQALPAPTRKSEDYYTLALADAVWGGGGFGTRLNMNLREDKGYSYGVFSNQALYNQYGLWWAQGGVQTNKTKESVTEFLSELNALAGQKPITEAELTGAKLTKVRGYAQQFESLGRIAQQVADLWAKDLPMSELRREPEAIEAATLGEVNASARKYAVPGKSTLLLVGDRAKIEPGLRELNAGDIVVLDVEGKRVN